MTTPPQPDPASAGPRTDRRKFLKGAAGVALGTSLYSFGDPLTVLAARMRPKALKPDGDLLYFNWAQYIDQGILKGFAKEYKVKVHEANFTNMQGMLAKLRAGVRYDVTFPEAQFADQLVRANFLLPLDHSKLENFDQIAKPLLNPWYDPGAKYSVPYSVWTTGIAWRSDKVHGMTKSWNDLWMHPEASGHTFLLDDYQEVIGMSLLHNHVSNINSTDSSQVGKAVTGVLKLKPRLRGFTSVNTEMINGTSWLTHMWSGTVYQALIVMKHPETLHYQVNKEGVPVGSDCLVIPKNAPHPNTAMLFLDYLLRPESSAANTKAIGYPMQTKTGLRTYGGLVEKYPWLQVTFDEVVHGKHFLPQTGSGLQLWDTAWAKIKA
jgi:spermidine/putrescine transport system substrate-binding protein